MNGLYGISLADNAINTQESLSKIILFLKYYTSDEYRLVKLKDEFAMIGLFGEVMAAGTGNSYNITANIRDDESSNLYIPSKSLLLLALDMLVFQNVTAETKGNMIIDAHSEERSFFISFTGSYFSDTGKIRKRADSIEKAFESAYGPGIKVELSSSEMDFLEIGVTLHLG